MKHNEKVYVFYTSAYVIGRIFYSENWNSPKAPKSMH